jgi:cob(I)alamin adenosyltransferase
VITGRRAPEELIAAADLVTEMRPLKHYYDAGVQARRGIEF